MTTRFIPLTAFTAVLLVCSFSFSRRPAAQTVRPNVLFIVVDDMNMLPVLKNYPGLHTPHIDALAAESFTFMQAACAVPLCAPSRAAFFSGIAPWKTGVYRNYRNIYTASILSHSELMPECFKRNGYQTWGAGKTFHMQVNRNRERKMFDNAPVHHGGYGPYAQKAFWYGKSHWASVKPWTGPDTDFPDVRNANAAISFLQQKHDRPFFMYYGLFRPHTPYTAPQRFYALYKDQTFPLPAGYKEGDLADVPPMGRALVDSMKQYHHKGMGKKAVWKKLLQGYLANLSFADWNVGRVLDALDRSPYRENTIVVFCSDNGFHLGTKDHWTKKTLWNQADRIPFMIRVPGHPGRACRLPVGLIDIFPTLVDYCRLDPPAHALDGHSLTTLWQNASSAADSLALTTWGPRYSSVVDPRYRYIRYPDGSGELYDHQADPYEWTNLIGRSDLQPVVTRLGTAIPKQFQPSIPLPAKKKKAHKRGHRKTAPPLKTQAPFPSTP